NILIGVIVVTLVGAVSIFIFFFSSRRRHTRSKRDWSSDVCSSDLTMYLGLDGTGVPMRPQEVADRAGKQADGSAKTREAKLVTVWTAESRDREGKPVRDPGSISYSSAIESAATPDTSPHLSDFAARVQRE